MLASNSKHLLYVCVTQFLVKEAQVRIGFLRRRPDVFTSFRGRMADSAGGSRVVEDAAGGGGVAAGIGVLFVAAASRILVSCFICAAVSLRSRFIYSSIKVVTLVAMALAAVSGILLILVWLLLLPPLTDLSSRLS